MDFVLLAGLATLGTWLCTALGAAAVLLFPAANPRLTNTLLGFSAGVMLAASFWSLLQPAVTLAQTQYSFPPYIAVSLGFIGGCLFLWAADRFLRRFHSANGNSPSLILLIFSITLHNIPEGFAVGVAFGALQTTVLSPEAVTAAFTIALGIGMQNLPEGAAVSLPLLKSGYTPFRAFFIGQATALVEPIAGIIGALLVAKVVLFQPIALSFAAGAMIFVAVHELLPTCQHGRKSLPDNATLGMIIGFTLMMFLDIALG